jgi:hypothetical protein
MPTLKKKSSRGTILAVAAVLLLVGCADRRPPALAEVGGRALVIGPDAGFNPASAGDPWWRAPRNASRFTTVDLEGTTVLRVDTPPPDQPTTSVLGRRLDVPLLAMPYLHWAWYVDPAIYGGGPGDGLDRGLKLSVGFYGGKPSTPQLTDRLFGTGPGGYPLHDRRFDITFGGIGAPRAENAMQRITVVSEDGIVHELAAARPSQSGAWKLEAVDIGKLYERFWPGDRINLTRIMFVAVGSLPGRPTVEAAAGPLPLGYVAEVTLTR